jgi:hypothetical protein
MRRTVAASAQPPCVWNYLMPWRLSARPHNSFMKLLQCYGIYFGSVLRVFGKFYFWVYRSVITFYLFIYLFYTSVRLYLRMPHGVPLLCCGKYMNIPRKNTRVKIRYLAHNSIRKRVTWCKIVCFHIWNQRIYIYIYIYIYILYIYTVEFGIAYSVYRRATSWRTRGRFPAVQSFCLIHRVQTDSGVQRAPYPMGTGVSYTQGKAARTRSWPLTSI